MEWLTTTTILHDLRDFGNNAAWEGFVSRFRSPIVRFACSLGLTGTDAEDAAQETLTAFAQAYRNGGYDPSKGRLKNWLFGIAYRQALATRRHLARRETQVAANGQTTSFWSAVPDETEASKSWDTEWDRALWDRCLSKVRVEVEPTTFRAFEMVVIANRTPAEAAGDLGMTRNAVFIAKHRVLTRVRALMREEEEAI